MYSTLILLFSLFSIAFSNPLADQECGRRSVVPGIRIVGGRNASAGEFPWQVSIGIVSPSGTIMHNCGGAILNKNTVLTAGHCVENRNEKSLMVRYNTLLKSEGDFKAVKKVVRHPKYLHSRTPFQIENDIAILHVDKPFDFNLKNVKPVCLPEVNDDPKFNTMLTVSGWGQRGEFVSGPEQLMAVQVPVVNRTHCNQQLKVTFEKSHTKQSQNITTNMFCAGFEKELKGTCYGDSGGPIVSYDKNDVATIRGVVSWKFGNCGGPDVSGVYTRIGSFMNSFIKDNLI